MKYKNSFMRYVIYIILSYFIFAHFELFDTKQFIYFQFWHEKISKKYQPIFDFLFIFRVRQSTTVTFLSSVVPPTLSVSDQYHALNPFEPS